MDTDNKLASFYREVSAKCEKEGEIEKALEYLVKAREADDDHEAFYQEEEERLRGMLRRFDAELFLELVALYRSKAVQTEDFTLYDRAEEYAEDLAERVGSGEPEALQAMAELRESAGKAQSGTAPETLEARPSGECTDLIAGEEKNSRPGEDEAGTAEAGPGTTATFAYDDVAKILSDYYDQNKDFKDEDGTVSWIDLLASLFEPAMLAPYEEEVRSGVLSGFADTVYQTLNGKGPNYQNALKALLEICQEYPCRQDDPDALTWYYHKSLDYLEKAKAAGAVTERQYNKIRRGIESYPPEVMIRMDEEAEQRAAYREQGLCQYCGGSFEKGLFFQKCSACGRRKDY